MVVRRERPCASSARVTNRPFKVVPNRRQLITRHSTKTILLQCSRMIDTFLVPEKTVVNAKGDGPVVDLSSAANRIFLLSLNITGIVEQESLDVSIYGSADGATWGPKPVTNFPQKFYQAQHPLLLDLTGHPEVKFLRAHWEVSRWGRGSETPMFEFNVTIKEVPTDILKEATAEAKAMV
jgi:hypothetical protein